MKRLTRHIARTAATCLLLGMTSFGVMAGYLLVDDQAQATGGLAVSTSQSLAREFTISQSSNLTSLEAWAGNILQLKFSIAEASGSTLGGVPGTVLFSQTLIDADQVAANRWVGINSLNIKLDAGTYWLLLESARQDGTSAVVGTLTQSGATYATKLVGGTGWTRYENLNGPSVRIGGEQTIPQVPEPPVLVMVLSALLLSWSATRLQRGNRQLHRSAPAQFSMPVAMITLALTLSDSALAQEAKKPPLSKPGSAAKREPAREQPLRRDFLEAREYIAKINTLSQPQPRGEFETREAYEARQPKLSDAAPALIRIERSYKDYSYDIDNKTLTIDIPVAKIKPNKGLSGLPFQAAFSIDKKEEYIGSNSYGAKVTVEKTSSTSYVLFIPPAQIQSILTEDPAIARLPEREIAKLPDTFRKRTYSLKLSAEPRDAERISTAYVVLLRIRPKDPLSSIFEATHSSTPTISEPKERTLFTRAIEVDLLEILVRDGPMGPELIRHTVGAKSSAPTTEPASDTASESASK